MFPQFPKQRYPLPDAFQKIYVQHYRSNRQGTTTASSLSRIMETWLHRKVAEDVQTDPDRSTLEIGAGTLNHLAYENTRPYDIVEPFVQLGQDPVFARKIGRTFDDIHQIPGEQMYERIISIATFEHITDLPDMVARTCFLLKKDGVLRAGIPNEGTMLWKLGWKLTTGLEFRLKYHLDYGVLLRYEHVNTADEIEQILHFFYRDVNCTCFGVSKQLAFYRFYECFGPKIDHALQYTARGRPGG